MMRALYSGVSGLRSQQVKLDVISNNIANISTTGYKSQTVSFNDILCQTLTGATAANSSINRGGTNPIQVGLGVAVASTDTNMSVGSTQSTGNTNDLSIGGSGFFVVKGGAAGDIQFTRAGNFGVDQAGNLTVNGNVVCGWQEYTTQAGGTTEFNTQKSVEPINLYSDSFNGNKKTISAQATTNATLIGNLDPAKNVQGTALNAIGVNPTSDITTTMTTHDAQGNAYDIQVNFSKCFVDTTDPNNPVTSWYWETNTAETNLGVAGSGYIQFDKSGNIMNGVAGYSTNPLITLSPSGVNASTAPFNIALDFTGISTYATSGSNGVTVANIDGYEAGDLQDFSIGSDGVISGVYSNGQKAPLGMIALANFSNPSGLEKIGNNLYITTANSGDFTGGLLAGTGGTGLISAGTLEMSNVDLASQFSEMMITQRAYQANSKVISASDELMQTLVNLIN